MTAPHSCRKQGVRVGSGDVLLLRTGWMRVFTVDGNRQEYMSKEPGLGIDCVEWLHGREVAAVAQAVEVLPGDPSLSFPSTCFASATWA